MRPLDFSYYQIDSENKIDQRESRTAQFLPNFHQKTPTISQEKKGKLSACKLLQLVHQDLQNKFSWYRLPISFLYSVRRDCGFPKWSKFLWSKFLMPILLWIRTFTLTIKRRKVCSHLSSNKEVFADRGDS